MKTILICNQKGGVGKSTIADLLMWEFEKEGIPASFYDLDGQGGVIHETYEDPDAKVAVVDTPGALQEQMKEWIDQADLIIIPTKTTMMDMNPLMRMIKLVKDVKCPVIYVEMMWNRYTTAAQFDEWLINETEKKATIYRIPQSEMIAQAAAMGVSVVDYAPKAPIANTITKFVKYVRFLINV